MSESYGTKTETYRTKSESYGIKTETYKTKSESYGTKTETYRTKSESYGTKIFPYETRIFSTKWRRIKEEKLFSYIKETVCHLKFIGYES